MTPPSLRLDSTLKSLSIFGLRGFATEGHLEFAIPSGVPGSGLTILVGPNNAGKTTIIEALRALAHPRDVSFARGRRNQSAGDKVVLRCTRSSGSVEELASKSSGSAQTYMSPSSR